MIRKKAQHEIIGFVLIIIIVCIVGLIFLSFSIKEPEKKTSAELRNFLQASMSYTSNCAKDYSTDYLNLQDLIKQCYRGEDCFDNRDSCDVLNSTMKNIINILNVNKNNPNKAINVSIYFKNNQTIDEFYFKNIGDFENCNQIIGASESIFFSGYSPGNIILEIDLCKG